MFVWDNFKESKIKPFIKSISQPTWNDEIKKKW
jgi:hypothetical protein